VGNCRICAGFCFEIARCVQLGERGATWVKQDPPMQRILAAKKGFVERCSLLLCPRQVSSGTGSCAPCVVKPGCPQEHTINFYFLLRVIYSRARFCTAKVTGDLQ
jgi:hypothetical protein